MVRSPFLDAETVQVVNAVGVAPSKDLTLVPSSAQVEGDYSLYQ